MSLTVSAVAAALAVKVVRSGLADGLAEDRPEAALGWRPNHAEALEAAAEKRLEASQGAGDLASVRNQARRAADADPLDPRPLRLLALVADRTGDKAAAATLMQRVLRRTHRDRPTLIWSLNRSLTTADARGAVAYIDLLWRLRPDFGNRLQPMLIAIADSQGFPLDVLAAALKAEPSWRETFLRAYAEHAASSAGLDQLIDRLRSGGGVTPAELQAYAQRLVRDGRYQAAYGNWTSSLPFQKGGAPLPSTPPVVFDSGFEQGELPPPFGRAFVQAEGAYAETARPSPASKGLALKVVYDHGRGPEDLTKQLVLAPDGRDRLRGQVFYEDAGGGATFEWRLSCADDNRVLATKSIGPGEGGPWKSFEVVFDRPAEGCGAQWLSLRASPGERFGSSRIWFDDVDIGPLRP